MADRLGNPAAARYVGIKASTWRAYVQRGQAPPPDGFKETTTRLSEQTAPAQ